MAKKLIIFMASVGVAAAAVGAYTSRKRRNGDAAPLLDSAGSAAQKFAGDWRADDALTTEFASVVADEVGAAR